ncbi:MAG TPA: diacylglycerol kinase family protein [Burkholderiales bacterium]|nr:diacylglycerol kinase family protein [Burkholderiales bacterium]
MRPSFPVIVNAAAGSGCRDEEIAKLRDAFDAAGAQAHFFAGRRGEELQSMARRAASEKPAVIVVVGGDGTINAVASALVGTGIALGIVPLGTFNHFAKDLHIALDLEAAVRTIVGGRSISVDVGEVNDRIFLNNSSVGLYPAFVLLRERQRKRLGRGKWHAMFWAAITVLRRSPFLDVRLRLDQVEQHRRTPFVFIGNNEYRMQGFDIGQRERLDSGWLSVYVTQHCDRSGLIRLALAALLGRLQQGRDFIAETAHSLRIESRHKHLLVATDGEVTPMQTPLDYRIRAGALRVLVPAPDPPDS